VVARQRAEKTIFTEAEIVEGFMKTAFGANIPGRPRRPHRKYDSRLRCRRRQPGRPQGRKWPRSIATSAATCASRYRHGRKTSEDANVHVQAGARDRVTLYRAIDGFLRQGTGARDQKSLDRNACRIPQKDKFRDDIPSDPTVDRGQRRFRLSEYAPMRSYCSRFRDPFNDTRSVDVDHVHR